MTSVGGTAVTYNGNKSIATALGNSYGYDHANRLTSGTIGGTAYTFVYDPQGRLYSSAGGRFLYAGAQLAAEYNSSGVLTARHVPGPELDQPVASYAGAARVQQIADERGSIIGVAETGGSVSINRYDEYGVPDAANRFQYTGQAWMAPGLYHYRARAYAPQLGRFLQPDPIGYQAGVNLYGYVGGDPINRIDPFGLDGKHISEYECRKRGGRVVVTKSDTVDHNECHFPTVVPTGRGGPGVGPGGGNGGGGNGESPEDPCGGVLTSDPVPNPRLAPPAGRGGNPDFGTRGGRHHGLDIYNPPGSPVFATGSGTVVRSDYGDSRGFGGQVIIDHGGGVFTQSGHMHSLVAVGTAVRAGTQIGVTAAPGARGSGNLQAGMTPHVHFEVRMGSKLAPSQGGRVIDPKLCLPGI